MNLHAIEPTRSGDNVASMAWGGRNLISTQVAVVSWYPPGKRDANGPEVDGLVKRLLAAAARFGLELCLHLEPWEGRTAAAQLKDVAYAVRTYGAHEAYHKIDGKCVFFAYDSYQLAARDWRAARVAANDGAFLIALALEDAGLPVERRLQLGGTQVVREALLAGQIDIYPEYTGNAAFFFNEADSDVWKNPEAAHARAAELDAAENQVIWLDAAPANNTWAIAVTGPVAEQNGLATMTDFGAWVAGAIWVGVQSLVLSLRFRSGAWRRVRI